jgi:hypothetical protein
MIDLEHLLRPLARRLDSAGVRWATVGGLAVSIRTEPRFTRDLDLVVAVAGDVEAERITRELGVAGYEIVALIEQTAMGRLATARLGSSDVVGDEAVVDLLFASSGIEAEIVDAAERLEILAGLIAPVATTGHLIALKLLSRDDETRPQDVGDLRALLAVASQDDLDQARRAVELITRRGYGRDRSLTADLEAAVARFRP